MATIIATKSDKVWMQKTQVDLDWTIQDFNKFKENGQWLSSQKAKVNAKLDGSYNKIGSTWYFCFKEGHRCTNLHYWLQSIDSPAEPSPFGIFSAVRVHIKNSDGIFLDAESKLQKTEKRELMLFTEPITLYNWSSKGNTSFPPTVNGSLTIHLELKIFTVKPDLADFDRSHFLLVKTSEVVKPKLELDAGSFGTVKDLVDLKITSSDGKIFPANKTILSLRSPVFCVMFKSSFREGTSGELTLADISGKTLEVVMKYIYDGTLSAPDLETTEDIENVAYAAEKYDMEPLRVYCDEVLNKNLSVYNVTESLRIAQRYRLTKTESRIEDWSKKL